MSTASDTLQASIEQAVRTSLAPVPFRSVAIEHGHDDYAEGALFIPVMVPPRSPLAGGRRYMDAMAAVSDILVDAGDGRIPYVRLHHTGEPDADEGERLASMRR